MCHTLLLSSSSQPTGLWGGDPAPHAEPGTPAADIVRRVVPPPRGRHASAVLGNGLWVYGGVNEGGVLGDLWRLDLVSFVWTCVWGQPPPTPPSLLSSAALASSAGASARSSAYPRYHGQQQQQQAPAAPPGPPPCYASVLACDPDPTFAQRRLYLLVGRSSAADAATDPFRGGAGGSVVWRFDVVSNAWEPVLLGGDGGAATTRAGGIAPPMSRADAIFAALDTVPVAVPVPRPADPFYAWLRSHVAAGTAPGPAAATAMASPNSSMLSGRGTTVGDVATAALTLYPASARQTSRTTLSLVSPRRAAGGPVPPPPPLRQGTADLQRLLDAVPDAWAVLFMPRRRVDNRTARERAAARAGVSEATVAMGPAGVQASPGVHAAPRSRAHLKPALPVCRLRGRARRSESRMALRRRARPVRCASASLVTSCRR